MTKIFLFLAFFFSSSVLMGEQKVVLISGASSGIGLATAKAFQERGWRVWAGYHKNIPEELKNLKNIHLCHLDVTDDQQVPLAVDAILKNEGRIDVLINNAGYGLIGVEESVTIKETQDLFNVNFFGALRLIQAVLPAMRDKKSGHIITISSGAGVYTFPGLGLYSASKYALESLSESLGATVSPWNIKVSIVEPGFVKTDWGKHCVIGSRPCHEEFYKKFNQEIRHWVTGGIGQTPEEIAALLIEIAENPTPLLRYQTSPELKEWIEEKLVDSTGMSAYRDNLKFIEQFSK